MAATSPYYQHAYFNPCSLVAVIYTLTANLLSSTIIRPFIKPVVQQLSGSSDVAHHLSSGGATTIDGKEKLCIVTGANTGIGKQTSLKLCEQGYTVILGCRSRSKGEEAAQEINSIINLKGKAAFLHPLDLSSIASVKNFAAAFKEKYSSLNVLVNNAGINTSGKTADGFDLCFQTNFLGHYLLTRLLMPCLLRAKNTKSETGRIVNLSSVMHHFATFRQTKNNWADATKPYCPNTYSDSKLAAILFTIQLNRRYGKDGIRALSVNPGAVNSDIWRSIPSFLRKYVLGPIFRLLYLNCDQGSYTTVAAVLNDFPDDTIYLQPYWLPTPRKINGSNSYSCPFPPFEMLGPFSGYAVTQPRLPSDGGLESSESLWAVCEKLFDL